MELNSRLARMRSFIQQERARDALLELYRAPLFTGDYEVLAQYFTAHISDIVPNVDVSGFWVPRTLPLDAALWLFYSPACQKSKRVELIANGRAATYGYITRVDEDAIWMKKIRSSSEAWRISKSTINFIQHSSTSGRKHVFTWFDPDPWIDVVQYTFCEHRPSLSGHHYHDIRGILRDTQRFARYESLRLLQDASNLKKSIQSRGEVNLLLNFARENDLPHNFLLSWPI